ncbi:MAG: hypothetical protein LKF52_11070 [Butyrivibrio sp.]|jgi:p-aminobenzoyl-glutamate transporter AbgT|nr:hypothetical protein [Butyrivibrio sp.]
MSGEKEDKKGKKEKKTIKAVRKNGISSGSRLIAPIVMLSATAIVAIYTYLQKYPIGRWLVIVLGTMVLFLIIGLILEKMIEHFEKTNFEKEEAERAAQAESEAQDKEQTGTDAGNNHQADQG